METIDGNDVYFIEAVNARGKKTMEYYDVATSLLVRKVQTLEGGKEPITQTSDYKNYQEVQGGNGYKVPYQVSESGAGQTVNAKVQTVEVNKGIADSEFN